MAFRKFVIPWEKHTQINYDKSRTEEFKSDRWTQVLDVISASERRSIEEMTFELVLEGWRGFCKEWRKETQREQWEQRQRDKNVHTCLQNVSDDGSIVFEGKWQCKGEKVSRNPIMKVFECCLDFLSLDMDGHYRLLIRRVMMMGYFDLES